MRIQSGIDLSCIPNLLITRILWKTESAASQLVDEPFGLVGLACESTIG